MKKLFRKPKFEYQAKEPSLNPNPLIQEGKLAGLIAAPLIIFLAAVIYIAKNYYITEMEFLIMNTMGLVMWIAGIMGVYAIRTTQANQHHLHDRIFGFDERVHPRYEIYSLPNNIRLLWSPEDKIKKTDQLQERLNELGIADDVGKQIMETCKEGFKTHGYYFRHHVFEGWDKKDHIVKLFRSHLVVQTLPYDKEYVFGEGQENWFGSILFNHSHCEMDIVQVLGWGVDPFTNDPMPICTLIHSSLAFKDKQESEEETTLNESLTMLCAKQHGIIDGYRQEITNRDALISSGDHKKLDVAHLARESAKTDIELFQVAMKEPSRGWLKSNWLKGILAIVTVIAIAVVIIWALGYLDNLLALF